MATAPRFADTDNDGVNDSDEILGVALSYDEFYGTYFNFVHPNPTVPDSEDDGLPDGWEVDNGYDPTTNSIWDDDNDDLDTLEEYTHGTFPRNPDSDGDDMPDGWEVSYGLEPMNLADAPIDGDDDGLSNLEEYQLGYDPTNPDTDGDGVEDGTEDRVSFWGDALLTNMSLDSVDRVLAWLDSGDRGTAMAQSDSFEQPTWIDAVVNGHPVVFPWLDDSLQLGSGSLFQQGTTQFTGLLVIRPYSISGDPGVERILLRLDSGLTLGVRDRHLFVESDDAQVDVEGAINLAEDQTYFVALRADAATGTLQVWLGDQLEIEETYASGTSLGLGGSLSLGREAGDDGMFSLPASYPEVVFFDTALEDSQLFAVRSLLAQKYDVYFGTPPSLEFTAPLPSQLFPTPATVQFDVAVTEGSAPVSRVEYLLGNTMIGSSSASPYSFTWLGLPQGDYEVRARAVAEDGAGAVSSTLLVRVSGNGDLIDALTESGVNPGLNTGDYSEEEPVGIATGSLTPVNDQIALGFDPSAQKPTLTCVGIDFPYMFSGDDPADLWAHAVVDITTHTRYNGQDLEYTHPFKGRSFHELNINVEDYPTETTHFVVDRAVNDRGFTSDYIVSDGVIIPEDDDIFAGNTYTYSITGVLDDGNTTEAYTFSVSIPLLVGTVIAPEYSNSMFIPHENNHTHPFVANPNPWPSVSPSSEGFANCGFPSINFASSDFGENAYFEMRPATASNHQWQVDNLARWLGPGEDSVDGYEVTQTKATGTSWDYKSSSTVWSNGVKNTDVTYSINGKLKGPLTFEMKERTSVASITENFGANGEPGNSFVVYGQWSESEQTVSPVVVQPGSDPVISTSTIAATPPTLTDFTARSVVRYVDDIQVEEHHVLGDVGYDFTLSAPTVSASVAGPPKYRKIALNGAAIGDSKPQAESESDQALEESYIDAFNRQLVHSSSDIYVPIPNSQAVLQVQRSTTAEVWNDTHGLKPSEKITTPFGPGWNSNLCAYVQRRENYVKEDGAWFLKSTSISVVDPLGGGQRFGYRPDLGIYPLGDGPQAHEGHLSGDGNGNYTYWKKHGTVCNYADIGYVQTLKGNRKTPDDKQGSFSVIRYARLTDFSDRHGNVVTYTPGLGLIPSKISGGGMSIGITSDNGRISSVEGPDGKVTSFLCNGPEGALSRVDRPDGTFVTYGYEVAGETEPNLLDDEGVPHAGDDVQHSYLNLTSITNEHGHQYSISYEPDALSSVWRQHGGGKDIPAVVRQYGRPMFVQFVDGTPTEDAAASSIELGGGPGYTVGLPDPGEQIPSIGVISGTTLTGTFANGGAGSHQISRHYSFGNVEMINDSAMPSGENEDPEHFSVAVSMSSVKIEFHDPNNSGDPSKYEEYVLDPESGMGVKQVVDFSGNVTDFEYDDGLSLPIPGAGDAHGVVFREGYFTKHSDPTSETRYLDDRAITKRYAYDPQFRMMTMMEDAEGRTTYYDIDPVLGVRTSEAVYDFFGRLVQLTEFTYGTEEHPRFMTRKRVRKLGWDGPGGDLVVDYEPDEYGRVLNEIVDPTGLRLITSYKYDLAGRKKAAIDPRNKETKFEYDDRGRLEKVIYPVYADPDNGDNDPVIKVLVYNQTPQGTYAARAAYENQERTEQDGQLIRMSIAGFDSLGRKVYEGIDMDLDGVLNCVIGEDALDATDGDIVSQTFYNELGMPIRSVDPRGIESAIHYDWLGRPETMIAAVGKPEQTISTMSYDGPNSGGTAFNVSGFKPTSSIDAEGYSTVVEYDDLYRPVKTIREFSKDGNLSYGTHATTETTFDDAGNALSTVAYFELPLPGGGTGSTTTHTAYDALNRPTLVTNPDNTTISTAYTSTGLQWKVTDEMGRTTETYNDSAGRPYMVFAPEVELPGGGLARPTTVTYYDANGNAVGATDANGNLVITRYDSWNRPIQVQTPSVYDAEVGVFVSPTTDSYYDGNGNAWKVVDPKGNTTETTYDNAGRATHVQGPPVPVFDGTTGQTALQATLTSSIYDLNGNVVAVTDANGNLPGATADDYTTSNEYDALNRLVKTIAPLGGGDTIETEFSYDKLGNRETVTDGMDHVHTMHYDGLNRQTRIVYPDNSETESKYNALNLIDTTDADNKKTEYTYDLRQRPATITFTHPVDGVSMRTHHYDDVGNLELVDDESGNDWADVSYVYDALNRVTSETSGGVTHSYSYDLVGNMLSQTAGGTGTSIVSTYDAHNRLATMTENGRVTTYLYDSRGNAMVKQLANGQTLVSQYDAQGRKELETTYQDSSQDSDEVIQEFTYFHDAVGNVRQVLEQMPPQTDRTVTNSYDSSYRLTSETISEGTEQTVTSYLYDKGNNRTQKQRDVMGTPETELIVYGTDPDGTNQLPGYTRTGTDENGNAFAEYVAFEYDNAGNRTKKKILDSGGTVISTDHYEYDVQNRLVQLIDWSDDGSTSATYQYAYDYRTRRIGRDEDGDVDRVSFSGGTSLQEYDTLNGGDDLDGLPAVEYVRGSDWGGGIGGILYSLRGGNPSYNHYNARGDVVVQTNSLGTVTYQASYEAYGTRTREAGSNQDRQRANTKDEDPTGLLNEHFRYRDLVTGTFITRDPAGFVDGPNMYSYVRQNPWTFFDPLGLSPAFVNGDKNEVLYEGNTYAPINHFTDMVESGAAEMTQKEVAHYNYQLGLISEDNARRGSEIRQISEVERVATRLGYGVVGALGGIFAGDNPIAQYEWQKTVDGWISNATGDVRASEGTLARRVDGQLALNATLTRGRAARVTAQGQIRVPQLGTISGFSEIRAKAKQAQGSQGQSKQALGELEAAVFLHRYGINVHFQVPKGRRGAGTADFRILGEAGTGKGGVAVDVLTPQTQKADNVILGIASKNNQAEHIIVNLRHTSVQSKDLGSVMERLKDHGATNIKSVTFID